MQTATRPHRPVSEAAADFLDRRRIAVTGVTRKQEGHGANVVYERLRERGYEVFAVNPNAETVAGDRCYPDLRSIAGGVEAVVIGTAPEHAEATVRECVELGIGQVWMHRSLAGSSVSAEAAAYGREHGLEVIAGGCPLMFGAVSDGGHRAMRWICQLTGAAPRRV